MHPSAPSTKPAFESDFKKIRASTAMRPHVVCPSPDRALRLTVGIHIARSNVPDSWFIPFSVVFKPVINPLQMGSFFQNEPICKRSCKPHKILYLKSIHRQLCESKMGSFRRMACLMRSSFPRSGAGVPPACSLLVVNDHTSKSYNYRNPMSRRKSVVAAMPVVAAAVPAAETGVAPRNGCQEKPRF